MINLKHFRAVLRARNREFIRDRASWAWNLIFPILLIVGLALAFGNDNRALYTIGIFPAESGDTSNRHDEFLNTRHLKFVDVQDLGAGIIKVERHQMDLLLDAQSDRYWINDTSPAGYIAEKILLAASSTSPNAENLTGDAGSLDTTGTYARQSVTGEAIRYVDWVVPGVLGLNMVFACLFGVGYVIVRYRKSGVLKRLKATPLRAIEFLCAQIVSRLALVMLITSTVFAGTHWFLGFTMNGSYLNLILILVIGAFCLISLGLVFAAQTASEELAGGLLNTASWPMMILSGVWFSMEGAHPMIQAFSSILPLTHIVDAARSVMIDGAGFFDIAVHLVYLIIFAIICLIIGSALFRWE